MGAPQPLGARGRWCLDTEPAAIATEPNVVAIRGWVALDDQPAGLIGPFLATREGPRALRRAPRPDVERAFPQASTLGFDEVVDFATLVEADGLLRIEVDGATYELDLGLPDDAAARGEQLRARQARKLARIDELLVCPDCRAALPGSAEGRCRACGYAAAPRRRGLSRLPSGVAAGAPLPPYSAHRYDAELREMLDELAGKLVLDAGAGLRYEYFDDVVNLEMDDFPTIDVLGVCERLPFADASFDGVISVAVLEHVREPRACAAELARVLRPGGKAFVAIPFLQPYHGYPHHYFNATQDGLRALFADEFEIDAITVPSSGHPVHTLRWFLEWYLNGLPDEVAAALRARPLGEVLAEVGDLEELDWVRDLDAAARHDLACLNLLRGTRRG